MRVECEFPGGGVFVHRVWGSGAELLAVFRYSGSATDYVARLATLDSERFKGVTWTVTHGKTGEMTVVEAKADAA